MKQIITTVAMALLLTTNASSQCVPTTGNYEFSITNDANIITIKARNTTNIIRSSYIDPALQGYFAGLVFGIKWSSKSDISLSQLTSTNPFNVIKLGSLKEKNIEYKQYHFQSFVDEVNELFLMPTEWLSGNWNTIAIISYHGMLTNGDKFELTECGFDPTTDPYFAQMDNKDHYGQYAPAIVPNSSEVGDLQIANAVIVYPNPTKGNLYVDVSSSIATRTTFTIIDMTGKTIKTIQSDLIEGLNKITIDVNDIADGVYMIKVSDGKALKFGQKFTKQ